MKRLTMIFLVVFLSCLLPMQGVFGIASASSTAPTVYIKASACDNSTIALKSDGTVWTWGRNEVGQLGDGTQGPKSFRVLPGQVSGLSGVVDVAAGQGYNVALKSDGTVWAWGIWGRSVEPGEYSVIPVKVEGFSDIKGIAAGTGSIAAIKKDGTVWQLDTNPMLPDFGGEIDYSVGERASEEDLRESKTPYQIKGISGIKSLISVGDDFAVVKEDGTVWEWGYGLDDLSLAHVNLDEMNENESYIPRQVKGISNVSMLAVGNGHMMALKNDGTVWVWGTQIKPVKVGANNLLETEEVYVAPTPIPGLSNVSFLAAAPDELIFNSAVVVKKDGTVWRKTPYTGKNYVKVENLIGAKSVAVGADFIVALKTDGTLWAWGGNEYGQLGNGFSTFTTKPEKLAAINNVASISTGPKLTTIIKSDGSVWYWGSFVHFFSSGNDFWNRIIQNTAPVPLKDFSNVKQASAGAGIITLVKKDGTLWAMGDNYLGELGDGTKIHREKPIPVSGLKAVNKIYNIKRDVSDFTVALMSDRTLRAWGYNARGQLGDGTKTNRTKPIIVKNINNVTDMALGISYAISLKSDGTVWGWGSNREGTLGNGTYTDSLTPVMAKGLTNVIDITTCTDSTAALKSDGTVWAWGSNFSGQLGLDSKKTDGVPVPTKVEGIRGVKAIAAGDSHMLALKSDGTVWSWGSNEYGQLGDDTFDSRYTPQQIPGLSDIIAIDAAQWHNVALKKDGTLWVWGYNNYGQLGNGAANNVTPVKVRN